MIINTERINIIRYAYSKILKTCLFIVFGGVIYKLNSGVFSGKKGIKIFAGIKALSIIMGAVFKSYAIGLVCKKPFVVLIPVELVSTKDQTVAGNYHYIASQIHNIGLIIANAII